MSRKRKDIKPEDAAKITIDATELLRRRLKTLATARGITLSELLLPTLNEFADREEKKQFAPQQTPAN